MSGTEFAVCDTEPAILQTTKFLGFVTWKTLQMTRLAKEYP